MKAKLEALAGNMLALFGFIVLGYLLYAGLFGPHALPECGYMVCKDIP